MQKMDDSVIALYKRGLITPYDAYMKVLDKKRFERILEKEGKKVAW